MKAAATHLMAASLLLFVASCSESIDPLSASNELKTLPTFDGGSEQLKATEIVPTLNTPIPAGKNAVWCASFLSAWKALDQDVAGEMIALDGDPELAKFLNTAKDPRPHIPESALYVATGRVQNGIIAQVHNALRERFPEKKLPNFDDLAQNSFIAYSYLEAGVKFSLPYRQNLGPLVFIDGTGNKVEINSFGLSTEDRYKYKNVRAQARVLFWKSEGGDGGPEFAIDLCSDSKPSEIVVARIAAQPTLAAALDRVEKEVANMALSVKGQTANIAKHLREIGPTDAVLVPDFYWSISHHFSQLEGRAFLNAKLRGQQLVMARDEIVFRLNKSGAELKAESRLVVRTQSRHFFCDRPFLIYMKKRGAEMPYFVMWVDNAELMSRWQSLGNAQAAPNTASPKANP